MIPLAVRVLVAFRLVALVAVLGAPLACSSDEPSCDDHVEDVGKCERSYYTDICATGEGRCLAACDARASCEELEQEDFGPSPGWLAQCRSRCRDVFECPDGTQIDADWRCDGDEDCVGGADEKKCDYYECGDGALISADFECDAYDDCTDATDELQCGEDE